MNAVLQANKPLLPIGTIASALNIHQRTLRIWDEERILQPGRSAKNRRLYSLEDLDTARFIKYLSDEEGANRHGVRFILSWLKSIGAKPEDYKARYLELMKEGETNN